MHWQQMHCAAYWTVFPLRKKQVPSHYCGVKGRRRLPFAIVNSFGGRYRRRMPLDNAFGVAWQAKIIYKKHHTRSCIQKSPATAGLFYPIIKRLQKDTHSIAICKIFFQHHRKREAVKVPFA